MFYVHRFIFDKKKNNCLNKKNELWFGCHAISYVVCLGPIVDLTLQIPRVASVSNV
jgi:hypothetical protein